MEDRLAVRDAPRMGGGGYGGASAGGVDDSEEEKVYYGFGVFMGLPLADLRAMKEEYIQNQGSSQSRAPPPAIAAGPAGGPSMAPQRSGRGAMSNGSDNGNGAGRPMMENGMGGPPMRGPPPGARGGAPGPAYGDYDEYEMRDPMGRSHGMVRGERAHAPPSMGGGGMPRDMDPRMMGARGGGMMPQHPHYGGGGGPGAVRMPPGRRGMEYDASVDGIGGPNGGGHRRPHPDDEGDSSDGSYSAPKSHSLNFILH